MADFSAPLRVNIPNIESPIEARTRALSLQQLAQGVQRGGQQIQEGALDLESKKRGLEQMQALNKSYMDALTPNDQGVPEIDAGKLTKALASSGHGSAIPNVLKGINDFKKSTAELAELNGKVATAQADYGGIVGATVKAANYDPHLFLTKAKYAIDSKAVDPNQVAPLIQAVTQSLEQDPSGDQARQIVQKISEHLIAGSTTQQKLANEGLTAQGAQARGEAATANAKLAARKWDVESKGASAKADAEYRQNIVGELATAPDAATYNQILNREQVPHGIVPPADQVYGPDGKPVPEAIARLQQLGMKPAEQVAATQRQESAARAAKANTPTELAAQASDPKETPENREIAKAALKILEQHAIAGRSVTQVTLPNQTGPAAQLMGEEYKKTLNPGRLAQANAIIEGRATMPSASTRSQAALQIRDDVFRLDPNWSEQRAQVRKAFTTGPDGKNIGSLNTAVVHLGRLGDAAEALENGQFTPGNEAYNWLRDKFGSKKVTDFTLLKDAVAGEMATALKGNATDQEIEHLGKSIRTSNSPEQMRGVVREGMAILNDKANTYDERYHAQMPGDSWSPVLPSARAQLQKHGVLGNSPNKKPAGPQIGIVENGYRFKGGDPGKPENWEKIN